jgi:Na+/H+-dicarboxylate symporter
MKDVALFAFSTSSSAATIPVTLRTVNQDLGVNQNVASFVVPVGATINMDGTAIMQGLATVFIAQMSGIDLTLFQYIQVVLLLAGSHLYRNCCCSVSRNHYFDNNFATIQFAT